MTKFIGLVIALAATLAAIILGGNLALFINIPALLLVLGITLGLLLWTHGAAARALLQSSNPQRPEIAYTAAHYAWMSGVIGTLTGIVSMLATLDDPSMIGGGMATLLLALLYGALLAEFIFVPIARSAPGQSSATANARIVTSARALAGVALVGTLWILVVLLGSFANLDSPASPL